MDPNETLEQLRTAAHEYQALDDPALALAHADRMAECFDALDEWLSQRGFLPDAWDSILRH